MAAYAFLIANDLFDDEQIQPLRCPKNDMTRLGEVLSNPSIADFKIKAIYNKRHHEVPHEIATDLEGAGRDDTLLVYYAGHGLFGKNGSLYLAAQDTRKKHVTTTAVSVNGLLDLMQESNCRKRILVLDCCHSGAVEVGVRGAVDSMLGAASKSHGTYILTASTGLQTASEREEDGHGLFTKHLIEGLEKGTAARPGAVSITADDLYNYTHARVVESGSQEPLRWALGVGGDIVLANANTEDVEKRRVAAMKRFEQNLRDGLISSAAYGRAVEILVSVENNEQIYGMRRRIFDYTDGKIPYTALGAEITGQASAAQQQPVAQERSVREAGAEPAPRSVAATVVESAAIDRATQPASARGTSVTPRVEDTSAGGTATGAAQTQRSVRRWTLGRVTIRFFVLLWLGVSYLLAAFLDEQMSFSTGDAVIFFSASNILVAGSALLVAGSALFLTRRGWLLFFLIAMQSAVSLAFAGSMLINYF